MNIALDSLLSRHRIWRGRRTEWKTSDYIPSSFAELDARLPGGGWPRGALTEIVLSAFGIGELQLLMPALLQVNRSRHWIALIAPPYLPYAPAWQNQGIDLSRLLWIQPNRLFWGDDHLWAIEQSLRSRVCGAVLAWPDRALTFQQLRRLQLAAETGDCLSILCGVRPNICNSWLAVTNVRSDPTPAALQLRLQPSDRGLNVQILKARGGGRAGMVAIDF